MPGSLSTLICIAAYVLPAFASTLPIVKDPPTIVLDKGTFTGIRLNRTNAFLGIPYARPPVNNLRFHQAVPPEPYTGMHDATKFGDVCPQDLAPLSQNASTVVFLEPFETLWDQTFPVPSANSSEDCLSVNIYVPEGTKSGANLPVVVWLHIGAFLWGAGLQTNGEVIVERSIENKQPVIYVSLNFRVNAFGFLPGQEAKDAGITNLGLRDQREALRWIQRYIHNFGGDSNRVTLWGANAGSISAAFQMLSNNGDSEGLFSGAWMSGGFPLPLNNYSQLQGTYDLLVNQTECKGNLDSLECLRQLPYETLFNAMLNVPPDQRFGRWQIVLDHDFIADQPETLMREGRIARVPFVISDVEDEGTQTALNLTTILTDEDVATYLTVDGLPGLPQDQVDLILELYPSDPADGSPFGTGNLYQIYPQYKRMAAIIGDLEFHAQRRFFLNQTSAHQSTWSYLSKEFKLPFLGATDISDMINLYGPGDLTDRLINFVTHGNPNNGTGILWPQWTVSAPHQLNIQNDSSFTIEDDTFRAEGVNLLLALNIQFPE